ncbi:MAG: M48 family metallopeptidase [Candidatus Omnitrophota bacterium]
MLNIYLVFVLGILITEYILNLFVESLNIRAASPELPEEFIGYYDVAQYKKSQQYLRQNTRFALVKNTFYTAALIVFILSGGFNIVDRLARGAGYGPVLTGLLFAGALLVLGQLINILFTAYHTFVIEEKFGFNRSSVKTFILDVVKGLLVSSVLGAIIFSLVLWFFNWSGQKAWIYCWIAASVFQVFVLFIGPLVILPLFNKFTPLPEGELKEAIENYARKEEYKIKGIFSIDASRRSAKTNAFFTGIGKSKRIALFDTLIAKHSVEELVAVLAHEVGHCKKRHLLKQLAFSVATNGVMFFILSLFMNSPKLFAAFGMAHISVYASLFFFSFLYSPLNLLFSLIGQASSRRHEYEADAYVAKTYFRPDAFIEALKKLTVANLSNLTPHRLKVLFDYSHPPVLARIQAITLKGKP